MSKQIGFIGLGNMGAPMAENLLKAGFSLTVFDLSQKAVDALVALGASAAKSAGEAAAASDFLITILPRDKHIIDVYTAPGGVLENMREGGICIEMTSALGQTVIDLQTKADEMGRGIKLLDAPVSGGVAGAVGGTLTIMCGGETEILEKCRPVLEAMGQRIFYTGGVGSGKSLKMLNQLLNAGNTLVAAEAIFLAKSMNMDMDLFCNIVKESTGSSWVFSNNIPKFMLTKDFDAGFRLDLMKKDISLVMERIAQDNISLPVSTLIYQIYQAMENQGEGGKNYNVVGEWVEQQNPTKKS